MRTIEEMVEKLSPEQQQEVRDFIESLTKNKAGRKQKKLRLSWAGGLKKYRDKYTSVELQHKALEWWGD